MPPPPPPGLRPLKPLPGPAAVTDELLAAATDMAPFRFVLIDRDRQVMLGAGVYQIGERVEPSVVAEYQPLTIDGELVAYAHPVGTPNLSTEDIQRLEVMREALSYGLMAAIIMALLLGLVFSQRLIRSIRELTEAIRAMNRGELFQRVKIHSRDEVGVLADSFNRMSEELHKAYQELNESHHTISVQAEQLKELSIRDELTQLYNRRHFNEQAARIYAESRRYNHSLSLVIGDLDHFKQINDRFSHAVGDQVLRRLGEHLRGNVRDCDLVARYGGEEFVIAFAETPLEEAVALCERLRLSLQQLDWDEVAEGLEVSCSLGVSADLELGGYQQMLVAADARLYEAKQQGRNRVCY